MEHAIKIRTVRLGGKLGATFGREFRLAVRDGAEAIKAIGCQVKGFREYLAQGGENGTKYAIFYGRRNIDPTKELYDPCGSDEIRIMPIPQGSKRGGMFQVILGAALIAAAFIPGAGAALVFGLNGVTWGGLAFSIGVSLALGGIAQMLSPQPKLNVPDSAENLTNQTFSGPVNTTAQGGAVPIALGRVLVGSAVISAGIETEDGSNVVRGATPDGRPVVQVGPTSLWEVVDPPEPPPEPGQGA